MPSDGRIKSRTSRQLPRDVEKTVPEAGSEASGSETSVSERATVHLPRCRGRNPTLIPEDRDRIQLDPMLRPGNFEPTRLQNGCCALKSRLCIESAPQVHKRIHDAMRTVPYCAVKLNFSSEALRTSSIGSESSEIDAT